LNLQLTCIPPEISDANLSENAIKAAPPKVAKTPLSLMTENGSRRKNSDRKYVNTEEMLKITNPRNESEILAIAKGLPELALVIESARK
jgi:hypothetical protein